MDLPERLSPNDMLEVLNALYGYEGLVELGLLGKREELHHIRGPQAPRDIPAQPFPQLFRGTDCCPKVFTLTGTGVGMPAPFR